MSSCVCSNIIPKVVTKSTFTSSRALSKTPSRAHTASAGRSRSSLVLARRPSILRATPEQNEPPPSPTPEAPATPQEPEGLQPGQDTAIWTGVVALILGAGYLFLASVLDSREMLPPPPEALGL
eukprot:CAMPEP_0196581412 /NCGR_PEP_ID=MMETSP1081-20130531/33940_1 /TAXON_ID=36882 /ORGANISM="Pyramimonas amylifera, Strain CCMP720" /LENGTH=123 /DNA_ID=CAMNT_0041901629 /DNA_START=64 /DNA_END=435 /DNA_ORIENTATION=+